MNQSRPRGLWRRVPALLAVACFFSSSLRAEPADAIIARVNGESILLSQLKQAAVDQSVPARAMLGDMLHNEAYRKAITQLIDETLLVQEAGQEEIKADETEVAREVDGMLKELRNQFRSDAEQAAYLQKQKLTLDGLRNLLVARERRRALAARVVLKRVEVDTAAVRKFAAEQTAAGKSSEELSLSQIVIGKTAAVMTKEGERLTPEGRAIRLARQANAEVSKFGALARENSDDAAGRENGGYMGWVDPATLLPELRGQLASMKPGQVSPPIETPQGLHILLLHARHDARDILFSQTYARERERLVTELRKQANIKLYDLTGKPLELRPGDLTPPQSTPAK